MPRHNKLQLEILSLYRQFLRVVSDRPGTSEYVKSEFRKNSYIPKKNILQIEQIVRRAQRQLESLKKPTTKGIGVFQRDDHDEQK
ncbi:hypothetical protein HELRODRAFT_66878 [Helobdella robusta]|uniref:Complex 1 LYR protein domain-containing protein n=1 Tax=Helobdella robusta TaxID=6412 RepID=T1FYS3_HELRO|nr:hypothetical protein HELRODRAFT_66878 [Helobdella robusta]ESN98717.1 hypothetical protein HELRODRAFT_66878 [Helobdella robusta]